jgi:hypothetical protein
MGVKEPEREIDHSTELMPILKMRGTSLPVFIGPHLHVATLKT